MSKNITISIPSKLAKRLEEFPEVNWSQVARNCIQNYLIQRQNPDISGLLNDLIEQKGREHVEGRKYAETLIKQMGYKDFDIFMATFREKNRAEQERTYEGPQGPFDHVLSSEEILQNMLKIKELESDASSSFLSGLLERFKEVRKAIR